MYEINLRDKRNSFLRECSDLNECFLIRINNALTLQKYYFVTIFTHRNKCAENFKSNILNIFHIPRNYCPALFNRMEKILIKIWLSQQTTDEANPIKEKNI